jgi:hypothetical protein
MSVYTWAEVHGETRRIEPLLREWRRIVRENPEGPFAFSIEDLKRMHRLAWELRLIGEAMEGWTLDRIEFETKYATR